MYFVELIFRSTQFGERTSDLYNSKHTKYHGDTLASL